MKKLIQSIAVHSSVSATMKQPHSNIRKLGILMYKVLAKEGLSGLRERLKSMSGLQEFAAVEMGSWREPHEVVEGEDNPIDVLDIRHWLALAERAGVASVPARLILSLTEDEYAKLSGDAPEMPAEIVRRIASKVKLSLDDEPSEIDVSTRQFLGGVNISSDEVRTLRSKLYDAMDDVPADWVVRSNLCAGNSLKALAGTGVFDDPQTEVPLSETVKMGAGFLVVDDRRMVDIFDTRIMQVFCEGERANIHFLARPWVKASRYRSGNDPHRESTRFEGEGRWPCEWRVFVENGKVKGVSNYYFWTGEASPLEAHMALQAADAAQRIVDTALAMRIQTRLIDIELSRSHPSAEAVLSKWPRDDFSCTLDFIETEDGMMLIEGGPGHTPVGGAHPTAFMHHGTNPEVTGVYCNTEGVAFKGRPHLNVMGEAIGEPDPDDGCILSWEDVHALAAQYEPATGTPTLR